MRIEVVALTVAEIDRIRPLWEQLNALHRDCSVHFRRRHETLAFETRMASFGRKARRGQVMIDALADRDVESTVGYCLSSIEDGVGEIDSIFVERPYRGKGFGDTLMRRALAWFDAQGVADIRVDVVYANDVALPFYERHGFFPAQYLLKRKN